MTNTKTRAKMSAPYIKTAVAACLIMSAMIAGTVSFGFFMDPVTRDLGFDRSTFSLYFSLITIVGTVTLPVYGKLVARFGSSVEPDDPELVAAVDGLLDEGD